MELRNSEQTVGQLVADFYEKNNFGDDGGVAEKYVWIKFGFFSIPIPNAASRKANVYLHDVGHIVTGNDTTWKGESAVSAWEIAAGGWKKAYLPWLLTLWAMGLGVVLYFKSTHSSYKKGLNMNNVLVSDLERVKFDKMSLVEFSNMLSNKPLRKNNFAFWASLSVLVFVSPLVLILLAFVVIV